MNRRWLLATAALVGLATIAAIAFLVNPTEETTPHVVQPKSSPVPTPTIQLAVTPVFELAVQAIVAAAEDGDVEFILAKMERHNLCSVARREPPPECVKSDNVEAVAQIGQHISLQLRPIPAMRSWLLDILAGNKLELIFAAEGAEPSVDPSGLLFLIFQAAEPRYITDGGSRVDGLVLRIRPGDDASILELDFHCTRRIGCGGPSAHHDATYIESIARTKLQPIYCNVSLEAVCLLLGR